MAQLTILSPDEYISMPWRNGLGTTVEILKRDQPEDESGFLWRLSMADVVEDGPFSTFSGYDRTLVLLEGRGITLKHDGVRQDILQKPLQAARFNGESDTAATLHDGPIKDFNIMTRRGMCRAEATCSIDANTTELVTTAATLLVFAVVGDIVVSIDSNDTVTAPAQSLVLTEPTPDRPITIQGAAFIAVEIFSDKG